MSAGGLKRRSPCPQTPIVDAGCQIQRRGQVRQLIAAGVNVNATDSAGDVPLIMVAYLGHAKITRLLLEADADVTAVDPGMKATALHAAAYAGRTEPAKLLIEYGVNVNAQGPYNGYTALHAAIWQNNVDTARVIIEAGAHLTLRNHEGQTPLEMAKAPRTQADYRHHRAAAGRRLAHANPNHSTAPDPPIHPRRSAGRRPMLDLDPAHDDPV